VVTYRGVLGSRLFAELQFSQKHFGVRGVGGSSTSIYDSPFLNSSPLGQYNAPYFDETDPENRDNRQMGGSLSNHFTFLGSHDMKGGGEWYRARHVGGNSQSSTGYVFYADYLTTASGAPALDGDGRIIPTFVPGETLVEWYQPIRGAKIDI